MNATLRSIISFIVSAICITLVYLSMHTYEINPKGVVLPTIDKIHPAYQGNVTIYSSLTAPFNATDIGNISIEYHSIHFSPDAENKVIEKAKNLAAKAGGNGLIIMPMQLTNLTTICSVSRYGYLPEKLGRTDGYVSN